MHDLHSKAARIRLAIFDIDGVLTDGGLYFDEQGYEYKRFHVRDGHGFKLLKQTGVEIAVISGRISTSVSQRMDSLGVERIFQGYQDKLIAFETLCRDTGLTPDQIAHVGDDLPDLPIMRRVGLAIAVADAHPAILPHADWRTTLPGGSGAAREVCDLIMMHQGTLQGVIESHY